MKLSSNQSFKVLPIQITFKLFVIMNMPIRILRSVIPTKCSFPLTFFQVFILFTCLCPIYIMKIPKGRYEIPFLRALSIGIEE